jgi:hypothetical protein
MVVVSHVSRTIKPGLGMGCDLYGQDQRNIFVTETFIHNIYNNDVATIKLVLSLQLRRVRSVRLY